MLVAYGGPALGLLEAPAHAEAAGVVARELGRALGVPCLGSETVPPKRLPEQPAGACPPARWLPARPWCWARMQGACPRS